MVVSGGSHSSDARLATPSGADEPVFFVQLKPEWPCVALTGRFP